MKVAGCDLGKATIKFSILEIINGTIKILEQERINHEGNALDVFQKWYIEKEIYKASALGATGIFSSELKKPIVMIPEDAAQEAAIEFLLPDEKQLNLVDVGAAGYNVLSREAKSNNGDFRYRYIENDKCSSGAGENIQRMVSRFGFSLDEADNMALTAENSISITARCSVFAKSEMTHFANQGKNKKELLKGFFDSVAKNCASLINRNRVDGSVYLTGGCSQSQAFRQSFAEVLNQDILIPENALTFTALGASLVAKEQMDNPDALPEDPTELIKEKKERFSSLEVAAKWKDMVTVQQEKSRKFLEGESMILGLDLGSTGSKAVLVSADTGEQILRYYDRTQGNPVEASQRLISSILEKNIPDVKAIGVTGSGREAVATMLRATYPDNTKIIVMNEIVAHATAAISNDEKGGEDLSIIEIGGQDAKYIKVESGRIIESDMNKACSAGTGSFLEEQAIFYGVSSIEEFVKLAGSAKNPPDLGQMCTVHVADSASEAKKDGFSLSDIFAGFQYSVIHNYLNRVMGQRKLGKRIFFQGKPASNPSLAWTMAAVTGRDIVVPANPGEMGAWGIALCAREQLQGENFAELKSIPLDAVLKTDIVKKTEFRCSDTKCQTMCAIERTTINVAGDEKKILSGGACPKYEISRKDMPKLDKEAPNPFEYRSELIESFNKTIEGAKSVGIPNVGALTRYIPWLATLMQELGFSTKILNSNKESLSQGEKMSFSFDACGPVKITHAVCKADVSFLFFPKLPQVTEQDEKTGATCVTEQALPEIVKKSLDSLGYEINICKPEISFQRGLKSKAIVAQLMKEKEFTEFLNNLPDEEELLNAVEKANASQKEFERLLLQNGRETIDYGRKKNIPMVLVSGNLHVIHDKAINVNIPLLLRQNGALAIPMDAYDIDNDIARMGQVYWGDSNRAVRASLQARKDNDIFPVMINSFGCGPTSFTEQIFQSLLQNYPFTILESDGHGGAAGFNTRIQAFLQMVEQYRSRQISEKLIQLDQRISYNESYGRKDYFLEKDARYVLFSISDYYAELIAATFRSFGYDAVATAVPSDENYSLSKHDCSGKECISYQMIWGTCKSYLQNHKNNDKKTIFFQFTGETSCRAGVYRVKDMMNLEEMQLQNDVHIAPLRFSHSDAMSAKIWAGMVGLDLINQLYCYYLAMEENQGEAKKNYHEFSQQLVNLMEADDNDNTFEELELNFKLENFQHILESASEAYSLMQKRKGEYKTVFLSGDLYSRFDEYANKGLYQHLADNNVRIYIEPICDFFEYTGKELPSSVFRKNTKSLNFNEWVRDDLYNRVIQNHKWLRKPNVDAAIEKTTMRKPAGSSALTIGNVRYYWGEAQLDGCVFTNPWGCDNGLIEESIIRHMDDIPMIFLYEDGTVQDNRRIDNFSFRLHQRKRVLEPVLS